MLFRLNPTSKQGIYFHFKMEQWRMHLYTVLWQGLSPLLPQPTNQTSVWKLQYTKHRQQQCKHCIVTPALNSCKILHFALLHLGTWAPGLFIIGLYLSSQSSIFKCAKFKTLKYLLHVKVNKILHFVQFLVIIIGLY